MLERRAPTELHPDFFCVWTHLNLNLVMIIQRLQSIILTSFTCAGDNSVLGKALIVIGKLLCNLKYMVFATANFVCLALIGSASKT